MRWMIPFFSIAAVTVTGIAATSTPAKACGGFFCDSAQPVNQAAERIIFSRGDDGQVTAVIQILYEGPAERFAWMLPVVGSPEIAVSSDLAFTRLQQATNPLYQLNTTVEGTCRVEDFDRSPSLGGSGGMDTSTSADSGVQEVTVVNEGTVGPYDFVVISVDVGASVPAAVAVEWLQDNGYDIDAGGAERIGPYLESGMNLLSFRLTKGNDAGSIRPVILGFGEGLASIPIRPTAVAAVDNMGVMVWVLGPSRAFPVNYASLELNEALINWFSPTATYNDVVTEAANQAGGQGFVTEMAGPAGPFADIIFPNFEEANWTSWRDGAGATATQEEFRMVVQNLAAYDGLGDAVTAALTLPDGFDMQNFLGCPFCVELDTDEDGAIVGLDVPAFIAAVEAQVIEPMRATQALFDRAIVTRLYTTMSADEMVMDPSFDFNVDLPDVSSLHTADRVIECSDLFFQSEAPWRVQLADGQTVRGIGSGWPFTLADTTMPANSRILRVGQRGQGEVIVDNGNVIEAGVAGNNTAVALRVKEITANRLAAGGGLGDDGCGTAGSGPGTAAGLLLVAGFLVRRRRLALGRISGA